MLEQRLAFKGSPPQRFCGHSTLACWNRAVGSAIRHHPGLVSYSLQMYPRLVTWGRWGFPAQDHASSCVTVSS